ncbi:MAG: anaerobic ribonucleoside-triphosphate reductase activating protein, partial [Spirochaetes bacterium]|nr:anaerobic ribonucleoside-triphosphate reductase activating protein [Spirochaetota bacterium]
YIAMDIKTSFAKYHLMSYTGNNDLLPLLQKSIDWIINSKIPHEFRTTVVPDIVTIEDVKKIAPLIKGADKYILAQFRPLNTLNPKWENLEPYQLSVLEEMKKVVEQVGVNCKIRAGY